MEEANEFDTQVAFTKEQLEILLQACSQSGNKVGIVACKTALSALKVIEIQNHPPKRWESVTEEKDGKDF